MIFDLYLFFTREKWSYFRLSLFFLFRIFQNIFNSILRSILQNWHNFSVEFGLKITRNLAQGSARLDKMKGELEEGRMKTKKYYLQYYIVQSGSNLPHFQKLKKPVQDWRNSARLETTGIHFCGFPEKIQKL